MSSKRRYSIFFFLNNGDEETKRDQFAELTELGASLDDHIILHTRDRTIINLRTQAIFLAFCRRFKYANNIETLNIVKDKETSS